ncbi:MAG: CPBP family intramembrane metalloprotease [Henriciella sp.]|nr:CPBP family intramembrane metalloprotease [Henriciella sp.]
MPFLSADGISLVDIVMLAIIVFGLPLEALLTLKKGRAELASGKPGVRVKHYTQTILLLWGISIPILVIWAAAGRDGGALGFDLQTGMMATIGWGLTALIAAFFVSQYAMVSRSNSARRQLRDGMAENKIMSNFMPHTEAEYRVFNLMGSPAGIAEEVVFRGFLIWAFSTVFPLWAAAGLALAVFTALHMYQGLSQLPMVFIIRALVTLVYVLTGSLWPAIALHIFIDVINNSTVWRARDATASA